MKKNFLFFAVIPVFLGAQTFQHIRTPNEPLDLSTRQESEIAINRTLLWLQTQTNKVEIIPAVPCPPVPINRQQLAADLINAQKRDPRTGGGYWLDDKQQKPSVEKTLHALFILLSL